MGMDANAQSSMLADVQCERPPGQAWLSGKIVELAARHEIDTTVHKVFYAAMKPIDADT